MTNDFVVSPNVGGRVIAFSCQCDIHAYTAACNHYLNHFDPHFYQRLYINLVFSGHGPRWAHTVYLLRRGAMSLASLPRFFESHVFRTHDPEPDLNRTVTNPGLQRSNGIPNPYALPMKVFSYAVVFGFSTHPPDGDLMCRLGHRLRRGEFTKTS
jgi:hypothetical protein